MTRDHFLKVLQGVGGLCILAFPFLVLASVWALPDTFWARVMATDIVAIFVILVLAEMIDDGVI